MYKQSEIEFQKSSALIPGGVNSPVRAFKGVGGHPVFFKDAKGAYLTDVDDQRYIDYIGSWGPMILGHGNEQVVNAVIQAAQKTLSFGAPSVNETELAQQIIEMMPAIEKIRMLNSGTEAAMTAVRLARGFTQKDKIIKFNGCYHGHSDGLLAKAGSGMLTLGIPSTPGIPKSVTEHTLVAEYNNIEDVEACFEQYKDDIAAVIIEPIAGNMGFVRADKQFLLQLRELCNKNQTVLIFDEVMSGFRVARGGAQSIYAIEPDLTTLGKVIGGGMPVGALGGRKEIMDYLAPLGPVYQAGTLSGSPVAMAAGLATLMQLDDQVYQLLAERSKALVNGLIERAQARNVPLIADYEGGMFGFFFTEEPEVRNFNQVQKSNESRFKTFYHGMLKSGIYLAPSMYEAGFVSCCHGEEEIAKTLDAAEEVFKTL
ncbi:glutamate-1-semialdehyde-2,1-aminomutase [Legionella quinlivanii]|uniref:Glutamate-1-semialdehyde 2,1-aminomutase n=1 Tax=Legionella quinlivanii TaxID=45073 RepID=A0A0W0Y1B9_9GAMM|nr:glutamate-1-semialdehyde 2,1-aminomutase [Legionella quinlivanii]KTD50339.1 glutamate-1-semialdehyde-2,1-aminomutase [Legionella quinlivanii]MCW8449914.1 glutamate-1-semialdehyde 2,1-aminomutase [Legionella quinlivanii]SEF43091.1 glutamate-1-semialdehyde 2,1-aminomutase [Legionella quinlivanii DSM 21216]STY11939.1 glutamate-1-semialdehyde-2,1-aminomutase [Legionella quinlivanii]